MKMEEWKEYKLGDVCTKIGSGATPSGGKEAYKGGEYNLIRSQNVLDFSFSTDGLVQINDAQAEKLKNVTLEENDVLLNITGDSVARACILPKHLLPARVNQHVAIIRPNKEILDYHYLLYYLQQKKTELLTLASGGATRNALTKQMIESLIIPIPSLSTQQKIAAILSSLDDKIELNNKINENLEQQAQALFKSRFVYFEPFGGKMPDGWKIGKLSEIADISSGKRPPMKQSEYSNEVSIPLMGAASVMGYTNQVLYNEPILITGRVGTHGVIQRFNSECWPSDNTLVIKSNYYEYTYQILKNIDYDNMNIGSTQPLITQLDLGKVECIIPDSQNLKKFENLVGKLFEKHLSNNLENNQLSKIRDTLLPKLMSGEIDS